MQWHVRYRKINIIYYYYLYDGLWYEPAGCDLNLRRTAWEANTLTTKPSRCDTNVLSNTSHLLAHVRHKHRTNINQIDTNEKWQNYWKM